MREGKWNMWQEKKRKYKEKKIEEKGEISEWEYMNENIDLSHNPTL